MKFLHEMTRSEFIEHFKAFVERTGGTASGPGRSPWADEDPVGVHEGIIAEAVAGGLNVPTAVLDEVFPV